MKFTKMHGCGNDYIYVDGGKEQIPETDKPELVKKLSDRHFGIGGDGMIFIHPSREADFEMEMYNMDGTRAEMCGNGIRCVAKFVYDKGLTDKTRVRIVSCGKVKELELHVEGDQVSSVKVNMGQPVLKAEEIPVRADDTLAVPASQYDISVTVSAGVPIKALSSSSHKVNINWDETATAHVSLTNPLEYAGNRDFILDYQLTGEGIGTGLTLSKSGQENFFMLMVQPPERPTLTDIPAREYIFVLDVSGSMSGFPLDTAKELIKNLVSGLRETDTFNLILFSGTSCQMAARSLPATKENISKAVKLVSEQNGAGGTELSSALKDALSIPGSENTARNIVVVTDGYISGESEIFELINNNIDKADFFSFGIGSAVNRYLIDGIAAIGQGEPFVVTEASQASEAADRFSAYIQSPVLTDIQVSFDGFDAYDVEPAILPTLYASKPIVLLGKWKGEPSGNIQISGKTGTGDFSQRISVADAKSNDDGALGYLWARKRVERLTDYGVNGNKPEVKEEVTQLGLTYHMMTPYTSFIAVLDTVRNPGGESTDVDQPLPLPLEVSNLAVGYRSGSEPGDLILITGLALFLLLPFLFKKQKEKRVTTK